MGGRGWWWRGGGVGGRGGGEKRQTRRGGEAWRVPLKHTTFPRGRAPRRLSRSASRRASAPSPSRGAAGFAPTPAATGRGNGGDGSRGKDRHCSSDCSSGGGCCCGGGCCGGGSLISAFGKWRRARAAAGWAVAPREAASVGTSCACVCECLRQPLIIAVAPAVKVEEHAQPLRRLLHHTRWVPLPLEVERLHEVAHAEQLHGCHVGPSTLQL